MIGRPNNEPFLPRHIRCNTGVLSNYFFAPDGKVYFCECMQKDKGVVGTYYPEITINRELVEQLASRSVLRNEKCRECPYKFVCLGNCPKSAEAKGLEMSCGVFAEPDILGNLEFAIG